MFGARMRLSVLACACLLLGGAPAQAGEFKRMFEAALVNDPVFKGAQQDLASSRQALPQARAALLPNISLNASDANVTGARTAPNFLGTQITSDLKYRSPVYSLNLRMPLLNMDLLRRYRQAQSQQDYADTVFAIRTADLLERMGSAYLQRLYSVELARAAQSQANAAQAQADLAANRLRRGEGTRPEMAEAQAAFEMAKIQLRDAQDQLANAQLALEHVTGLPLVAPAGQEAGNPAGAALTASSAPAQPSTLEAWLEKAMAGNGNIRARRQAVELARLNASRIAAGHLPRLDLVASMSSSRNESLNTLNQSSRLNSIGLQLVVPLYAGGGVDAAVEQALAEQAKAEAELEAEERSVTRDVQRFFLVANQGKARAGAYAGSLRAAELTLEGARRTQAAGLGTAADVVIAEWRVADARREAAKIRLEDLLARLRLQLRAGYEVPDVVEAIDAELSAYTAPP